MIDVVGTLATDSLSGQIYLADNNKVNGSTGQGTEHIRTVVEKGDRLVWIVGPLESEAYAAIDDVVIDSDYCDVKKSIYEGTDIAYWSGIVKQPVDIVPYCISYKVGTRDEPIVSAPTFSLVGRGL